MKPDEARKLLGGYATGTLTSEEREALMAAALEDQGLFDAMAREEVLREALADAGVRAELLAAVTEPKKRRWFAGWPVPLGAAAVALAGITVFVMVRSNPRLSNAVQVADSRKVDPAEALKLEAPKPAAPAQLPPALTPMRRDAAAAPEARARPPVASSERKDAPREEREAKSNKADQRTFGAAAGSAPVPMAAPPAPPALPAAQAGPPAGRQQVEVTAAAPMVQQAPGAPRQAESQQARDQAAPQAQQLYDAQARSTLVGGVIGGIRAAPRTSARTRASQDSAEADLAKAKKEAGLFPLGVRYTRSGNSVTVEANDVGFLYTFRSVGNRWTAFGGARNLHMNTPLTIQAAATDRLTLVVSRVPIADRSSVAVERLRLQSAQFVTALTGELIYIVNPNAARDSVVAITIEAGTQ